MKKENKANIGVKECYRPMTGGIGKFLSEYVNCPFYIAKIYL